MKTTLLAIVLTLGAVTTAQALDIKLPAESAALKVSDLPGYSLAQQRCSVCHSAEYVNFQPPTMTPAYWKATVLKMRKPFGAKLSDQDIDLITEYLIKSYATTEK